MIYLISSQNIFVMFFKLDFRKFLIFQQKKNLEKMLDLKFLRYFYRKKQLKNIKNDFWIFLIIYNLDYKYIEVKRQEDEKWH